MKYRIEFVSINLTGELPTWNVGNAGYVNEVIDLPDVPLLYEIPFYSLIFFASINKKADIIKTAACGANSVFSRVPVTKLDDTRFQSSRINKLYKKLEDQM